MKRCGGPHGHDYHANMKCSGWTNRPDLTPYNAPPGCLISYNSRKRVGDKAVTRKGSGHTYGHVEIVALRADGKRQYVSDKPRNTWGGSVGEYWNKQGGGKNEVGIWCCQAGAKCAPKVSCQAGAKCAPKVK